jgi:hypothetical protein
MRISLRELMLVVAVAAIGLAGMKFASTGMLPVVQAMTGLFLLAFLVRAIIDRGQPQAFAIGFLLCGAAYLFTIVVASRRLTLNAPDGTPAQTVEIAAPTGTLGTQSMTNWFYQFVVSHRWVDLATERPEPAFHPTQSEAMEGRAVRIELKEWQPPPAEEEKAAVGSSDTTAADVAGTATGGRAMGGVPITNGVRGGGLEEGGFGFDGSFGGGGRGRARGGGRGRGRGGRGGFAVQLTDKQLDEYYAADGNRQMELSNIFAEPTAQQAVLSGRPLSTITRRQYRRRTVPAEADFQTASYCLWTLLFAYAGGSFARFIYQRRAAVAAKV